MWRCNENVLSQLLFLKNPTLRRSREKIELQIHGACVDFVMSMGILNVRCANKRIYSNHNELGMGSAPTQWTFIFWVERWKKQWTSRKQLVYKLGFFTYLIFGASKWTSRFNMIQLTQAKHSKTGQWGIASSWAFLAAAAFACRIHWMAGGPGAKRPFGWNSPPNSLQFVVKALVNWRKMQEHIKKYLRKHEFDN